MTRSNFRRWGIGLAVAGLTGAMFAACGHSCARHGSSWFGHHRHHVQSAAEAKEHVEHMSEWVLDRVDATDDQQTRVTTILNNSVDQMWDMRNQHRDNRDQLVEVLSQPTIDRQALENIQREELRLADAASSQFLRAVADVADVLTVEQRREMLEHFEKHHN